MGQEKQGEWTIYGRQTGWKAIQRCTEGGKKMNLRDKLNDLKYRRYGDDLSGDFIKSFSGKVDDELLYVHEAMQPVDSKYTQNTYDQCDRVQQHLNKTISVNHSGIEYAYQGSVPLNTHTRRHSDVDMLIITGRYYSLKPPLTPTFPYSGNAVNDMIELRKDIVSSIETGFPAVKIDDTGGKAVAISGGSLNRKIDLVPAAWLYNSQSNNSSDLTYRGIKLYDKHEKERIENYPFLHLYLCNNKDLRVQGRFKKLVRYIKNVRKDSEQKIDISSYDATSLIYHQTDSELISTPNNPAALSGAVETFLKRVIFDETFQKTATVPNGTRLLFDGNGLKLSEVIKLYTDICEINRNIMSSYRLMDNLNRNSFDQYFQKAS